MAVGSQHSHSHTITQFKLVRASTVQTQVQRKNKEHQPAPCLDTLHGLDNLHALNHASKNTVLAIQVRSGNSRDKELRSVGVGSCIGHGENSGAGVLELVSEILIGKAFAVDGFATSVDAGRRNER